MFVNTSEDEVSALPLVDPTAQATFPTTPFTIPPFGVVTSSGASVLRERHDRSDAADLVVSEGSDALGAR